MRVALLSDIHGNSVAGGVFWVLGDLVALGPDPVGIMDRLFSNLADAQPRSEEPALRWIRAQARSATSGTRMRRSPALT